MAISTLDGVESIRILRAAGNLKIIGTDRPVIEIDSGTAPRVAINAGVAEVTLRDNATLAIPAGVTVEVEDLAGNLDLSDLATPFVVTRRLTQSSPVRSLSGPKACVEALTETPGVNRCAGVAMSSA